MACFFNDTATTAIYTYCHSLSLHDALPIYRKTRIGGIGATSLPCLRLPFPVIPPNSRPMLAPILSYEDLGLIQGSGWLFQGLDLYIGERDRLALIGRNGAGKTTLLKLIAGSVEPDKGLRSIVPGTHVVMLEQDPDLTHF